MSQQKWIRPIEIDFYNPKGKNVEFPELGKYAVVGAAFLLGLLVLVVWHWQTNVAIEEAKAQIDANQSQITDMMSRLNSRNSAVSMEHWSNLPDALRHEKADMQLVMEHFANYLPADSAVSELKISTDRKVSASISFGSMHSMVAFREAVSQAGEFDLLSFGNYVSQTVPQANRSDEGGASIDPAFEPIISVKVELGIKAGQLHEGGTP